MVMTVSDSKKLLLGRCFCGEFFVASEDSEYRSLVSRHILDNHRNQAPDKPLVTLVEGEIDE